MAELDSLLKMANQIAANFRFHDDGIDRIADHLRRFWAPSMRHQLQEHIAAGGQGLSADVVQAARRLPAA